MRAITGVLADPVDKPRDLASRDPVRCAIAKFGRDVLSEDAPNLTNGTQMRFRLPIGRPERVECIVMHDTPLGLREPRAIVRGVAGRLAPQKGYGGTIGPDIRGRLSPSSDAIHQDSHPIRIEPQASVDVSGIVAMDLAKRPPQPVLVAWHRDDVDVVGHQPNRTRSPRLIVSPQRTTGRYRVRNRRPRRTAARGDYRAASTWYWMPGRTRRGRRAVLSG